MASCCASGPGSNSPESDGGASASGEASGGDASDQTHAYTNALIDENSPYLLQHAHNPVDWHPWGEAAFEKAKREDKPIFLSVGYSTCERMQQRFDAQHAGFGSAPKFPPHGTLRLLSAWSAHQDEALPVSVTRTLDAMWLGGMHDHIGGGFHRYATDAEWLLPHFEKMLYDNAQLMRNYAEAAVRTYTETVAFTLPFTVREDAKPGPLLLAIKLRSQACDAERCLAPEELTLRLPVEIQ